MTDSEGGRRAGLRAKPPHHTPPPLPKHRPLTRARSSIHFLRRPSRGRLRVCARGRLMPCQFALSNPELRGVRADLEEWGSRSPHLTPHPTRETRQERGGREGGLVEGVAQTSGPGVSGIGPGGRGWWALGRRGRWGELDPSLPPSFTQQNTSLLGDQSIVQFAEN